MKKIVSIIIILLIIVGGAFVWHFRGAWQAFGPKSGDIAKDITNEGDAGPLHVPAGFQVSLLAQVPGARAMVKDSFGNFWVSQTSEGVISEIDVKSSTIPQVHPVFQNLKKP